MRTRRRPAPDTTPPSAPTTADGRLTRRRARKNYYADAPTWFERILARAAGRSDGRRGTVPDPDPGHTAYTRTVQSHFHTIAEHEQIDLARILSRIDEHHRRLTAEHHTLNTHLDTALDTARTDPGHTPDPLVPADVDARRRERAHRRHRHTAENALTALRNRQQALAVDIAAADTLRAYQIATTDHRIHRIQQSRQQLVDTYWRSYLRAHPERSDVRAAYPIPRLTLPTITPVATTSTGDTPV